MKLGLHWLEEVDSTNLQARRMVERGCPEGTVVVAARQTAGRGRLGRDWCSPRGGLYLTAVLRPRLRGQDLGWISIAGGLAAAEELAAALGGQGVPLLKWPNDVLIGGRKVGGILGEAHSAGKARGIGEARGAGGDSGGAEARGAGEARGGGETLGADGESGGGAAFSVLVGIGLNLTTELAGLPERPVFPASTVLAETGVALEPRALGEAVAERLFEWYARLESEGPGALRRRLMQLTAHAGKHLEVQDGDRLLHGRDAGVSETGALLLDTGAEVIELSSGQILRIHPGPPEAK